MIQIQLLIFAFAILGFTACSKTSQVRTPSGAYEAGEAMAPVSPAVQAALEKDVQNYGGKIRFPAGLSSTQELELWHLTEGSDVFPLRWFINMKSQFSNHKNNSVLSEKLDEKFGVVKEPTYYGSLSQFAFPWVGISASWTEAPPTSADVRMNPGEKVQKVSGVRNLLDVYQTPVKSIAMVGVNCAFCHSNAMTINKETRFYDGPPSMLYIRGFFKDLYGTTASYMLDPVLLEDLLKRTQFKGDSKTAAQSFVGRFKADIGLSRAKEVLGKVVDYVDHDFYEAKKKHSVPKMLFNNRKVLQAYLEELLKMTYGVPDLSTELQGRMKFLSVSIGFDPDLPVTPEGYARTDAFGRIANLTARFDKPIPLNATASVPPMWNTQYRSMFHWNGNTNSVIMRNIGQSFGLGSILTNPNGPGGSAYDSTSNLHNIHKIESYLHKVKLPNWADFKGNTFDEVKMLAGCKTFHNKCASCHIPEPKRVGPTQELIQHKVLPLNVIKTDPTYTVNQAAPVGSMLFKEALFGFTGAVRDRYYQKNNVSAETQKEWENSTLRGDEYFRDTYLGEPPRSTDEVLGAIPKPQRKITYDEGSKYVEIYSKPKAGYPAQHLAAIWATAPYLHNGSVPTVWDLLQPMEKRPQVFFVGSREIDTEKLGYKHDFSVIPPIPDLEQRAKDLMSGKVGMIESAVRHLKRQKRNLPENLEEAKIIAACGLYPERCFFSNDVGNSNVGHEGPAFGTDLSADQKMELIEFLKVIRPEPEYSQNVGPYYVWNGGSCEAVR